MNQLLLGDDLIIFGDGEQRRAFTYGGDIIPAIAESVNIPETANQVFNIGAETHISVNELALLVSSVMGLPAVVRHVEARKEVKVAYSNHSKIKKIFPDILETPLPDGLQKMATWVKHVGARRSRDFENIEIPKNLPPVWLER